MSERQGVLRFIRQNIAGILVGLTLSVGALTVSSLTTTGNITASGTVTGATVNATVGQFTGASSGVWYSPTMYAGPPASYMGGGITGLAVKVALSAFAVAPNASPATTSEEIVGVNLSLAGGTFTANGQAIRVECWGTAAANANAKVVRVRYGTGLTGTIVGNACTFANVGDTTWRASWVLARTAANTQAGFVACDGAVTKSQGSNAPAIVDATGGSVVVTVQNALAAADLTVKACQVTWHQ